MYKIVSQLVAKSSRVVGIRSYSERMPFPVRSWMVAKKTPEGMLKAANSNADVLILDMEDAVAQSEKGKYREIYKQTINSGIFGSRPLFVRINGIHNRDEMFLDISELSLPQVFGFWVPKVDDAETLQVVSRRLEEEKSIQGSENCNQYLSPIIETSKGYGNLFEIANSSDKLCAISFGNQDFSSENMTTLCVQQNSHTLVDEALIAQTIIAARSVGVETISSISSMLDSSSSEKFYRRMKQSGCAGVIALTPAQVVIANREFANTVEEMQWAKAVSNKSSTISSYARSSHHKSLLVGPPHHKLADEMIKRQTAIDAKNTEQKKDITVKTTPAKKANPIFVRLEKTSKNVINNNFNRTVRESWVTQWSSNFLNTNPLYASDKLAQELGLKAALVPQMLMTTLAITMPVSLDRSAENSRLHLGIYNARPLLPTYAGDTLTGHARVTKMRNVPSIGEPKYTIVSTRHFLINDTGETVFSVDKNTMVEPQELMKPSSEDENLEDQEYKKAMLFKNKIIESWAKNPNINKIRDAQCSLTEGQVLLHDHVKAFSHSDHKSLCTMLRATNPHHHNLIKYLERDILVGGPLTVTTTTSNSDRDFGHIIHEELIEGFNTNKVNIGDQLSTITFVKSVKNFEIAKIAFEEAVLVQLGVKEINPEDIEELPIPVKLFDESLNRPRELEKFCLEHCDFLLGRLACKIQRRIVRQALN